MSNIDARLCLDPIEIEKQDLDPLWICNNVNNKFTTLSPMGSDHIIGVIKKSHSVSDSTTYFYWMNLRTDLRRPPSCCAGPLACWPFDL
jgi:hypothetical protein